MLCAFPVCMLTVLPRSPEQMVEHLMHSPTASSKQRVRQKRWLPPPLPRPDVVDVFEGNGFVSRDARFGQPPPRQVGTVMATTGGGGAPGIWSPRSELAPSPSAPALFRTSPSRAVPGLLPYLNSTLVGQAFAVAMMPGDPLVAPSASPSWRQPASVGVRSGCPGESALPTSDPTRSMRGSGRKSEGKQYGVVEGEGVGSGDGCVGAVTNRTLA